MPVIKPSPVHKGKPICYFFVGDEKQYPELLGQIKEAGKTHPYYTINRFAYNFRSDWEWKCISVLDKYQGTNYNMIEVISRANLEMRDNKDIYDYIKLYEHPSHTNQIITYAELLKLFNIDDSDMKRPTWVSLNIGLTSEKI